MNNSEIKLFLDEKIRQYKRADFIKEDPIQIPHRFTNRKDQEIAGFFASIIAWGNRKMILRNADRLMQEMGNNPYDFVINFKPVDLKHLKGSMHRTFMAEDFIFLIRRLKELYSQTDSLEEYFIPAETENNLMPAIERFRNALISEPNRASKHISSPKKGSAAKRLNMFLRWMVRDDEVDLGIWKKIPTSKLSLPLDTHTIKVAENLGLIENGKSNRKTLEKIDAILREWNPEDPVIYDFALFGLGVYEDFKKI